MFLFTANDIRAIDSYNHGLGQGTPVLMQIYAQAIADEVARRAEHLTFKRVLVLAGNGNNGGDGIAMARVLLRKGFRVVITTPLGVKSKESKTYLSLAEMDGIEVVSKPAEIDFDGFDVFVDALFGIGLEREVDGTCAELIAAVNAQKNALKISIDVPSGLTDAGIVSGIAFKADCTVTACGYKSALVFGEGQNYCGDVVVADLNCVYPRTDYPRYVSDVELPKRDRVSHKGNYANVFIFAGSTKYIGAGVLSYESCRAALGVGAGLSHLVVSQTDRALFAARVKEEILMPVPERSGFICLNAELFDKQIPDGSVVAIGMGGGKSAELTKIAAYFLDRDVTLIIDADGINMFRDYDRLGTARARVIFTPHVKEFSRMTGRSVSEILQHPMTYAQEFAAEHRVTVLLKSNFSVATDGDTTLVTAVGSPSLAKGGSGDVLAGVLAGLAGMMPPVEAAIQAAVVCAHAAVDCADVVGEHSVMASDIIRAIQSKSE